MTTQELDTAKAQAFAGQVVGILNGGMLSLMMGIGHRTGLFDTMAEMPPSTSEEIANKAGLNERYVREWLGAMVTGRIIDYDASNTTYHLPPEHAGSLTRAAGPSNMCTILDFLPEMAAVRDGIVECFQQGGGVPYSPACISLSVPHNPTRNTRTSTPRPPGTSSTLGAGSSPRQRLSGFRGIRAIALIRAPIHHRHKMDRPS